MENLARKSSYVGFIMKYDFNEFKSGRRFIMQRLRFLSIEIRIESYSIKLKDRFICFANFRLGGRGELCKHPTRTIMAD